MKIFRNILPSNRCAGILVLQTDFGNKDSAVAEMKGVALSVDDKLTIIDNTHLIEPFNIWEGAYRLYQSIKTFSQNTVFVSVIDPGVGTDRKSIVVRTQDNHYIVTQDNGTITFVDKEIGIVEAREIDETKHRLKGSEQSATFHGRDVYVYVGAKLASRKISFKDVGKKIDIQTLKRLAHEYPKFENGVLSGSIPALDVRFGNVWTNIKRGMLEEIDFKRGDRYDVFITNGKTNISLDNVIYAKTFGDVAVGEPVLYINSLDCLSIAINIGDFAETYGVEYGLNWKIEIKKS